MKRVLVVEDSDDDYRLISRRIVKRGLAQLIRARTLSEAIRFFSRDPEVNLIVMDACVNSDQPNTMPLIKAFQTIGYAKPIIAASTSSLFRQQLVDAGATHQASKIDVPRMALNLLNLA